MRNIFSAKRMMAPQTFSRSVCVFTGNFNIRDKDIRVNVQYLF